MLIAISGSQGSGKSTTLNALKEKGFNVVERKTSRSILSDWNVTLQEVNNDRELTLKFQDEIIRRKCNDERDYVNSDSVWFTERTFSDLFTYALVSLGKDNENSDWLDDYFEDCLEYNYASYVHTFYLIGGLFQVEHDGVRGSNQHYSKMVDLVMQDFTSRMSHPFRLSYINTSDLNERVEIISDFIVKLEETRNEDM